MEATPICRCRVLWLGSAVPQQSKDGLQGIQEPLRELYPTRQPKPSPACPARGIDSWLSVWSNGILLENVDENRKKVTRFFPIESLHYCAAVRHVGGGGAGGQARFLPLDSPFARAPSPSHPHPPLFAAILRRTAGIKVLECHAFICKKEMAANALVRCCFHAYADSSYARQATEGSVRGSAITAAEEEEQEEDQYDGDENHKVWAGSQENLDEGPYDLYGTGSRNKTPRPRQVTRPAPVPPPPPPVVLVSNTDTKKSNKKSNNLNNSHHHQQQQQQRRSLSGREELGRPPGPPIGLHGHGYGSHGHIQNGYNQGGRPWAATLPPPRARAQYATVEPRPLRAARSLAALDAPSSRRGHINERAFSYSIRQEHRARSHASLSSLKFAPPPHVESGREELKKEREILQLVAGLGLGGDDLEHREVPPGLYRLPR